MSIYMPIGLPGCGKTTYCKNVLIAGRLGFSRISADDIRQELWPGEPYDKDRNRRVFEVLHQCLKSDIIANYDVVVDNTNLFPNFRQDIYIYAKPVHIILFTNIGEAIERNRSRTGVESGVTAVPDDVMKRFESALLNTIDIIDSEPWTTLTVIKSFQSK